MASEYGAPREYLDDVIPVVELMLQRARGGEDERALLDLDLEIGRREELLAARLEATAQFGERVPLDHVRIAFGLSPTESRVLAVLAVLELSADVRKTAGELLGESSAATLGLVEALVYRSSRMRIASAAELAEDGRLFAHSLAELGDAGLPWLARPVRVARRILELALGRQRLDIDLANVATLVETPPDGSRLRIDPAQRATVDGAVRRQLSDPRTAVPLLVGPGGAGRCALALAAASGAEKPALVVRGQGLPRGAPELARSLRAARREALLFGAVLVVRDLDVLSGDEGRGVPDLTPIAADVLAAHRGPLVVTASRNVWPPTQWRPALVVELGVPSEADRVELWSRELGAQALAEEAAGRYRVTGGVIARAAAAAREAAATRGEPVGVADLRVGVRDQLDAELATLGRRVDWRQTWADLVVADDVRDELSEMVSRVRHRRRVLDEWGFSRKVAKGVGVSALFSGPPGTGKTMVAGLIAMELGLDLYQIDVSRMVSKWIGETEKNLGRLFDAAAAGHVVLLFDEADSLFAKRTEVKSSNDRYANLEVNYLLQRMEAFEGITILTTNLETSVDEAFQRRLAFRIKFPVPELDERIRLWRAMLPAEAEVSMDIDFRALAERFEMTGGYIRNAVLRAAYLAAAQGSSIRMHHLARAAAQEYQAMGKLFHHDL